MPTLTVSDISAVADLVLDLCGIYLDESKDYLIEARLNILVEKYGCHSMGDFVQRARSNQLIQNEIVDAITTNETLFFRDDSPFEALKHKAIPETIDARESTMFPRRLRVWSAACSTGQEVYSIAMTLCDLIPDIKAWDIQIYGTDICRSAIDHATTGVYSELEIGRGMQDQQLNRYFSRQAGGNWRINDTLRSLCRFERRNLMESFADIGPFDIVFCRNVAIYFTPDDRKSVFERIADNMSKDGYLFVGSSESLADIGQRFEPKNHCRSVFYRPNL